MFLGVKRDFYRGIFKIAGPMTIRMLIWWAFMVITFILVGKDVSAVKMGNDLFKPIVCIVEGLSIGAGIFIAQYYGKNDKQGIRHSFAVAFTYSFWLSIFAMLVMLFFPRQALGIFTKDPELIRIGTGYLRIICFSYCLDSFIKNLEYLLQNTYCASIIPLPSFICYSLRLIIVILGTKGFFGSFLSGVNSIAFAAIVIKIINVTMLLYMMRRRKHVTICSLSNYRKVKSELFLTIGAVSLPLMFNEGLNSLITIGFDVVLSRNLGARSFILFVIIFGIFEQFFIACFSGYAKAVSTQIGTTIGHQDKELLLKYSRVSMILALMIVVVAASLVILFGPYLLKIYPTIRPSEIQTVITCSYVVCAGWMIKSVSLTCRKGISIGGGDTLYSTLVENIGDFGIGLVFAFVFGAVLKLPLPFVLSAYYLAEPFKLIAYLYRIHSGKWVHKLAKK